MKSIFALALVLFTATGFAQEINKTELSLKVTDANQKNNQALKAYIWKKRTETFIGGQSKAVILTELKFNDKGEPEGTVVDATTTVKKKPGLRGKAQASAIEDKMEYVEKAVQLSTNYTYMSKGELIDFFDKATVTKKGDLIEATADNFKVQGDKLTIQFDAKTYLYKNKKFNTLLGKDLVEGEVTYSNFTNGTNHVDDINLNLPAQNMIIKSKNQDWTQRVN